MIKVLFKAILILSLSSFLALPAAAAQKQISREAEEACFDELVECVVACTFLEDDAEFGICNGDCNDNFGICTRGDDVASTSGTAGQAGQSNAGVLSPPKKSSHATAVGTVGAAEIRSACKAVDGIFDQTSKVVGCVNQSCENGNCSLVCFGGKCFALTPDPLQGSLTLLGILQNGDMVLRESGGTSSGSDSGASSGSGGGGTGGTGAPSSGGGGGAPGTPGSDTGMTLYLPPAPSFY